MIYRPLFSVLIANYNNGRYIEEAISSVLAQTYSNWEIILIDDGSTDKSIDILEKYKSDPRIKIHFNGINRGCGYAKRKCVEFSNGELCGFLDSDDALTIDALSEMVEAHFLNLNASLIYSLFYYCDEKLLITSISSKQEQIPIGKMYLENGFTSFVSHFASFKKYYYLKTDGIDIRFKRAVDLDMYLKLDEVGPFYFLNKALYFYRVHKRGISQYNNDILVHTWGLAVLIETCLRRGSEIEEIVSPIILERENNIRQETETKMKRSKEFVVGSRLKPVWKILWNTKAYLKNPNKSDLWISKIKRLFW